jgi:tetratricopeptide (TPR) repeat protein
MFPAKKRSLVQRMAKPVFVLALVFSIAVWFIFFSGSIRVDAVPFGLQAGTKIEVGERAAFPKIPAIVEHDLRRADDLRMAGALEAAKNNYETILLTYPDLPAALFGAAYSLLASGVVSPEKSLKARTHIENLAKQMPGSVWVRLLSTFSMETEGNLNSALETAAELVRKSPAFSEARLRYSDLLLANEQPLRAMEEAKAAISISKGLDARPFVSLAFALHKTGSLKECSELVNYAMPRFPSQTDFLLLHGFLSEYSYDFDTAQDNYKKILLLKPGNSEALNALASLGEKSPPTTGVSASASGMSLKDVTRETAKIMMPLIQEYPENLPLREALGKIYLKARMMKEAKFQFSEIYAQDFEYPNIKKLLEEASEELGSSAPKNTVVRNDKNLADSLAKTFATLRQSTSSEEKDDLGRYLIHYGASFKDFFSEYSITGFKRLDETTFSEKYSINPFRYENTVYFDSQKKLYAMRSVIEDMSDTSSYDYIFDLFEHFTKKEAGFLGEGVAVERTECKGERWKGVIWVSRDNFELLMQSVNNKRRIFILRLHAKKFNDTGNLCSYVPMLKGERKTPYR